MEQIKITDFHDNLEGREQIEWANIWYSQANIVPPPEGRILLIGDSNVRLVRSTFERMAKRPVDMFGSSYGLNDVLFLAQLEALFASRKYKFDCIFVQMGHHSIRSEHGEKYTESDFLRFRSDYISMLCYLKQYCQNIVLLTCFLNVTPLPKWASSKLRSLPILFWRKIAGEDIDWTWSETVLKKNKIILEIAKTHGYKFCDIDWFMRKQCKGRFPRYIHTDHIHYEANAKMSIVMEYMKYL